MSSRPSPKAVLVHLASGIGNIVLATPLLTVLARRGFVVDVRIDGDYPETADLFRDWGALRHVFVGSNAPPTSYDAVLPAVPPFYWERYAQLYRRVPNAVRRPPDAHFYQDEQAWYLAFLAALGGAENPAPYCTLPVGPDPAHGTDASTLALAPGCKTGEMAAKRWPHFAALAAAFPAVAVLGTPDDLPGFDGATQMAFPRHVLNLIGRLTLRQTAEALASAGAVVANDCGLGHIAAAVGVPTVLLFGPTPSAALGRFPPNVAVLRSDLTCAPCWFNQRFVACARRIDCLRTIMPADVIAALHAAGFAAPPGQDCAPPR
jgi:ADP-heptose:LPS heptosyltransferase